MTGKSRAFGIARLPVRDGQYEFAHDNNEVELLSIQPLKRYAGNESASGSFMIRHALRTFKFAVLRSKRARLMMLKITCPEGRVNQFATLFVKPIPFYRISLAADLHYFLLGMKNTEFPLVGQPSFQRDIGQSKYRHGRNQ